VRAGDTIEKIAHRFNALPASIRLINLVDNDSLKAGERIIIPARRSG
jgi:hypothetical protein